MAIIKFYDKGTSVEFLVNHSECAIQTIITTNEDDPNDNDKLIQKSTVFDMTLDEAQSAIINLKSIMKILTERI